MSSANPFPNIEAVVVDPGELAGFKTEDDFNSIAVSLMVEVGSYVCIAASILGPSPTWSRDRAVVGGNLVRLYKLVSAFLDQVCQRRRETSFILARLVFETAVTVTYLVERFSPELMDDYVRHSLRHERKLRDRILSNVAARGGQILPIEDRMLKSIERAAKFAGVHLDTIDLKQKGPWGGHHLHQKAQEVGMGDAYLAMFSGASHYVHGSWQDLYEYHLEAEEENSFTPRLEWRYPRPQVSLALGRVILGTLSSFFDFVDEGTGVTGPLQEAISDLDGRLLLVSNVHEEFLQRD